MNSQAQLIEGSVKEIPGVLVVYLEKSYMDSAGDAQLVRVVLTVTYQSGTLSITPIPILDNTTLPQKNPFPGDNPYRFGFINKSKDLHKWEAIAELIIEATRRGRQMLEAVGNPK